MEPSHEYMPRYLRVLIWTAYAILTILGYIRMKIDKLRGYNPISCRYEDEKPKKGYAPMFDEFDHFYQRHMYRNISDCWNRPINSMPGAYVNVMKRSTPDRNHTYQISGESNRCLNLGSYNYLGFAQNEGPINDRVVSILSRYGTSGTCSTAVEVGTTDLHRQLEEAVAKFVGKESAMVFGMGYLTNSTTLPAIVGKGDLVISDSFNHASLVMGCKASGATVKPFLHNNMEDLEKKVKEAISSGSYNENGAYQLKYKRILILVEGVYSMEGNTCNLPEIVRIKKKYKCYLYVDEAHSIGAMGKSGRGVVEFYGIDPEDVDIMMGTFTKSFGSVGGYIAASSDLIAYLKMTSFASVYCESIAPACVQQILAAFEVMNTPAGLRKIEHLHAISNWFREELRSRGFVAFGGKDSPVVPLMIYLPTHFSVFSRGLLCRGIAIVVISYPTPMNKGRVRFCLPASHSIKDLKTLLLWSTRK
eukprot:TRINITY_DN4068_c0_g1_i1.p1 TRINITY_DN4068_c0_g1~~TRINITY_DN4068_c0_g1_i1.p1  ORF type:complete len:475 (-),score=60.19 TRINITY_DN4068_c0_g1_i1:70-1494(-)